MGRSPLIDRYVQEALELGDQPKFEKIEGATLWLPSAEDHYLCESPIERLLGSIIVDELGPNLSRANPKLLLSPQWIWARYRADWAIVRSTDGRAVLLLECDGKEFHSTPQQLAKDARKDASARALGIAVVRFSGSEIFNSPEDCANRILRTLSRIGVL